MKPQAAKSLEQSHKFLTASEVLNQRGLINPSVSAAVHAAIHAKDALCIEMLGVTRGTKSHVQAISELQKTGVLSRRQLEQFSSVISAKTEAEYGSNEFSEARGLLLRTQALRFRHFVMDFLKFPQ